MKRLFPLLIAALLLLSSCSPAPAAAPAESPPLQSAPTPEPTPQPTPEPTPAPTPVSAAPEVDYMAKYEAAKAENGDVWGYIHIDGTAIDAPIMKSTEDYHYAYLPWNQPEGNVKEGSVTTSSIYTYNNMPVADRFFTAVGYDNKELFHDLYHIYDFSLGETGCERGKTDEKCSETVYEHLYPDLNLPEGRRWRVILGGEDGLWEVFSVYSYTPGDSDITDVEQNEEKVARLFYDLMFMDQTDKIKVKWQSKYEGYLPTKKADDASVNEWVLRQRELSEIDFDNEVPEGARVLAINTGHSGKRLGIAYCLYEISPVQ